MRLRTLLLLAAAACAAGSAAADAPTLSLNDAIRLALQRNRAFKVSSYGPGIARANLLVARGAFDPSFLLERNYNQTQFGSAVGLLGVFDQEKIDYYQGGVQGLLPLGTQYSIYASTAETRENYAGLFSKNFETFAGFQVTQPLLQGFGLSANLRGVRIQKANRDISDQAYRQAAINTVSNVVNAYINLQFAHDQLDAASRSRALAYRLLDENKKKFGIGNISQSDVIVAQAYAAQFDAPILSAERQVRNAQDTLRELIGDDTFFEDEPLFVLGPIDLPDASVDRREDLRKAYEMRPDYQIARLGIVQNKASEEAARNAILPMVNFVGGYGYNGSAENFSPSRQMVEDHMNPSVSAGLTVTIPFTFAVGRGNLRAAKLSREQSEENLRSVEADIAVQVAQADGQVETTRETVAANRAALDFAKQALDAEEKKNKAGTSSTLAVVQEQEQESQAEDSLSASIASERSAIVNFDQALGTTLERFGVKLGDN